MKEEHENPLRKYSIFEMEESETKLTDKVTWLRYWSFKDVYLSDICLAVHLEPAMKIDGMISFENAKEELRTFMRHIGNLIYEYDYIRPVACVIGINHIPIAKNIFYGIQDLVHRLQADQEWHRGSFTLYLEKEFPERRLQDLLGEQPAHWIGLDPVEPRSPEELFADLDHRFSHSPPGDETAHPILRDLLEAFENSWKESDELPGDRGQAQFNKEMNDWVAKWVGRAQQLADGE